MVESSHPQLALRLSRKPNMDFNSFYPLGNELLVNRLQQVEPLADASSSGWVYIWGPEQSGKSHLLQAAAQLLEDSNITVFYLAGAEARATSPLLLENLATFQVVVIDDIHLLLGDSAWEEALFHFYNKMKDLGSILLVSADAAPRRLSSTLADLVSRLMAMEVYQVQPLDDEKKTNTLRLMAQQRGFSLSDDVITYILSRSNRQLTALQEVVERLDHRSLQEKRVITVPFVKKVMGW
jgi:DnaA family protein